MQAQSLTLIYRPVCNLICPNSGFTSACYSYWICFVGRCCNGWQDSVDRFGTFLRYNWRSSVPFQFFLGSVFRAYYKNFMRLGNEIIQGLTAEAFETGFAAHVIEGRAFYTYFVNALVPRTVKTIRKILEDM